jgi:hypothetical protein
VSLRFGFRVVISTYKRCSVRNIREYRKINQMFEINFVNHDILLKIKTGYIKTDEGGVNTPYKSNKKQKMGTYVVNIYGWLIWKLTVPQRTLENKTNMHLNLIE